MKLETVNLILKNIRLISAAFTVGKMHCARRYCERITMPVKYIRVTRKYLRDGMCRSGRIDINGQPTNFFVWIAGDFSAEHIGNQLRAQTNSQHDFPCGYGLFNQDFFIRE